MEKVIIAWHNNSEKAKKNLSGFSDRLGGELNITRPEIILMLLNGEISRKDTLVTKSDRKFFYSNFFFKVISYEEYENNNFLSKMNVLHLYKFNYPDSKNINVLRQRKDMKFYPRRFYELLYDFDIDVNIANPISSNNVFVIVHYSSEKILTAIPENIGVVIFTSPDGKEKLANTRKNLAFSYSLEHYASLGAHKNCLAVIGPISDEIQLQYYFAKNVFVYATGEEECPKSSLGINLRDSWDETKKDETNIYYFGNIQQLIEFIMKGGILNPNPVYEEISKKFSLNITEISPNFDPAAYLYMNVDIRNTFGWSKIDAYKHYFHYGFKEGRKISSEIKIIIKTLDFDWKRYLREHEDLFEKIPYTKYHALKHFLEYGFFEERKFFIGEYEGRTIDWNSYYKRNKEKIENYVTLSRMPRNNIYTPEFSETIIEDQERLLSNIRNAIKYYLEIGIYNGDLLTNYNE